MIDLAKIAPTELKFSKAELKASRDELAFEKFVDALDVLRAQGVPETIIKQVIASRKKWAQSQKREDTPLIILHSDIGKGDIRPGVTRSSSIKPAHDDVLNALLSGKLKGSSKPRHIIRSDLRNNYLLKLFRTMQPKNTIATNIKPSKPKV